MIKFIQNYQIYEEVTLKIAEAKKYLWIGSANAKDLRVEKVGQKKAVPFLQIIADLLRKGVSVRMIYAKPTSYFLNSLKEIPGLDGLEIMECSRIHFKSVIIDGIYAYTGSANLTGAGMGMKGPHKRNHEAGIITDDPSLLNPIMNQFDDLWMLRPCDECRYRSDCSTVG